MFIKTIITKFSQTIKLRIVHNNSAIALQLLDSDPIIIILCFQSRSSGNKLINLFF